MNKARILDKSYTNTVSRFYVKDVCYVYTQLKGHFVSFIVYQRAI